MSFAHLEGTEEGPFSGEVSKLSPSITFSGGISEMMKALLSEKSMILGCVDGKGLHCSGDRAGASDTACNERAV